MLLYESITEPNWLDTALEAERPRLVRLCALLSGDSASAEDLAQETLIEAWRLADRLYDPQGLLRWLSAIARNICLRRRRSSGREFVHRAQPGHDGVAPIFDETLADDFDLELELERSELAELLDRALALLPPETRALLVQKYVEESPHAEIAARMGLSENAVAVRLHRGKLALKRVLTTDLRNQIAPYGLVESATDEWEETNIWCVVCGQHRVLGRFIREHGDFTLTCPNCIPEMQADIRIHLAHYISTELFQGVKGYKPALTRLLTAMNDWLVPALISRISVCPCCGKPSPLRHGSPSYYPATIRRFHGVYIHCDQCGDLGGTWLDGLALALPEGQRFWRDHPRIRIRPEQEIEFAGRPALLVGFESVVDDARFEAVFALDTFEALTTSEGLSIPAGTRSTVRRIPLYGGRNVHCDLVT
jgi:RNA polymerase sigma-70 factor (ECF subfamily)